MLAEEKEKQKDREPGAGGHKIPAAGLPVDRDPKPRKFPRNYRGGG